MWFLLSLGYLSWRLKWRQDTYEKLGRVLKGFVGGKKFRAVLPFGLQSGEWIYSCVFFDVRKEVLEGKQELNT